MVLLGLLAEFVLATEVPAKANLEEDEGTVLRVEGVGVQSGINGHYSGVDDVQGGTHSCRHQVVKELLREDACRYVPVGHAFFVIRLRYPLQGESLRVHGLVNSVNSGVVWVEVRLGLAIQRRAI